MSDETNNELVSIDVTKDFKFAYRGCDVHAYEHGKRYDVPAECADLAVKEKWAKKAKGDAPANASTAGSPVIGNQGDASQNSATPAAPANAAAVGPDNKGA
jgi:hypothetical protein